MSETKLGLHKYVAVTSVIIVLVMTVLDVSVMNVALPVIAKEFHTTESASVWLVTVYQLIIVMLLLPLSSIGDQYSYRRNFLTGVILFTLGSGLCAASQSFEMLLSARVVQALGGAGVMSVNVALTRTIYPRNILGRGLALNAMFISIATAAGPSLAGWIMSISTWHWLFIINLPFGVLAFFIGRRTLPHNPNPPANPHFDWVSGAFNMIFFGLTFYALGSFSQKGDVVTAVLMLSIAACVGILYVKRQKYSSRPMFPIDLFKRRLYSTSIFTSVCSFMSQNLTMVALPFLYLTGMDLSELLTGLVMTPWPLATMIISPLAARWIEKHNPGFTAAAGMCIFVTGLLFLIFMPSGAGVWDIVWRMAICGVGFGFFQTPNNIVMVMATPVERTGAAGGMQSTARLTGQTLGSTLVTIIFAVVPVIGTSVRTCLWIAFGFALTAGLGSLDRGRQITRRHITL
ncbi:MAG: MFS transporter [Muribaculaceae bacterium]|nr:MFS transporter [Muribaculaceae bacterium]